MTISTLDRSWAASAPQLDDTSVRIRELTSEEMDEQIHGCSSASSPPQREMVSRSASRPEMASDAHGAWYPGGGESSVPFLSPSPLRHKAWAVGQGCSLMLLTYKQSIDLELCHGDRLDRGIGCGSQPEKAGKALELLHFIRYLSLLRRSL